MNLQEKIFLLVGIICSAGKCRKRRCLL